VRAWDAKIQTLPGPERVADLPVMKNETFFTTATRCLTSDNREHRRVCWAGPLRRHQGFTLTELLVIVAILGTLITIAIPTFGLLSDSSHVKGAAQAIATDLQLAKMRAISQSKKMRLLFIDGTSYKFQYYDTAGSVWRDLTGEMARDFDSCANPYHHEGVSITPPLGNEVVFQPWGSSTSTSIQVQNARKQGTITVSSTGKISTEVIDL